MNHSLYLRVAKGCDQAGFAASFLGGVIQALLDHHHATDFKDQHNHQQKHRQSDRDLNGRSALPLFSQLCRTSRSQGESILFQKRRVSAK